jgi:predicted Zn-dependent protease
LGIWKISVITDAYEYPLRHRICDREEQEGEPKAVTNNNRLFSVLGILAGLLLTQACSRELPPQEACSFVQNSQSRRVSWGPDVPVDMYVDRSVPVNMEPSVRNAINQWNNQFGKNLIRYKGYSDVGSDSPSRDGYSKIYFMNTWDENKTTEQARTTVYWSGSRIYEADIRINDKNFNFFTSEDVTAFSDQRVHLDSLIIHELGHVLGLSHNEASSSVMRASLAYGYIRDEIEKEDLSSLACEY